MVGIVEILTSTPLGGFVGGLAVATISALTAAVYNRRKRTQDKRATWYQNAVGLVARVQQAGYRTTTYQTQVNYPKLHEKLEPLAEEIQEHSGNAPNGVDEEARIELAYLSAFCSGVLTLTEQADEVTADEFYQNIQRHAQANYDGEYSMEEVNEVIEGLDVYALVDDLPADIEINQEALDEFRSHFSEESLEEGRPQSIDEAINIPLDKIDDVLVDDRVMEDLLMDSLGEYVRTILTDWTQDIYARMEERKKRAS